MAKWPARDTIEIDARCDGETGKWFFAIVGAGRRVMDRSEPLYESDEEARAAARDWLLQTLLR
jgi:hypothetical protein